MDRVVYWLSNRSIDRNADSKLVLMHCLSCPECWSRWCKENIYFWSASKSNLSCLEFEVVRSATIELTETLA